MHRPRFLCETLEAPGTLALIAAVVSILCKEGCYWYTILPARRIDSTVLKADKIVVLENGQIVSKGSHEELLQQCSRYKNLYDLQFNSGDGNQP